MNEQTFDYKKFRPKNATTEQQTQQENIPSNPKEEKPFDYKQFRPENYPEESKFDSLLRQGIQYGSRALERVAGIPADTKDFLGRLLIDSYEQASLTGIGNQQKQREAPDWLKSTLGQSEKPTETLGGISEGATSPELREFSEKASQGYTKPRTYAEEKIGNTIGDIASSLMGGNRNIRNNLLVPIGANLVETGVEMFGGDKDKAQKAKQGAWFLLGLNANANANQYASQLQQNARNNIPQNLVLNPRNLSQNLSQIWRNSPVGDVRSSGVRSHINNILGDIREGRFTVRDVLTRIDAINAEIDVMNGFDYMAKTPSKVRRAQIRNLNELKTRLYDNIRESTRANPQLFNDLMEAQSVSSVVHRSNSFADFVRKHWKGVSTSGAGALFGGLKFAGALPTLAGTSALLGLHKAAQLSYRVAQSPQLRGYYRNVINSVLENNVPVFIQNMEKLDHELKKKEKKVPFK